MAEVKISALPAASTVVAATDVAPLVSGGVTTKATPQQMVNAALAAGVSGSTAAGTSLVTITQTGAGYALRVEDEANPDATPFIVHPSGAVSIGNTTDAGANNLFVSGNIAGALVTATTAITSASVKATNSSGISFQNASSTEQMSIGVGGSNNISLNVATNINPANAQVSISPTGTGSVVIGSPTNGSMDGLIIGQVIPKSGTFTNLEATAKVFLNPANETVSISPTGTGSVTINPATLSAMNNTAIGLTTRAAANFTSVGVKGTLTLFNGGASGDPQLTVACNDAADAIIMVPSVIGSGNVGTLIIDVGDSSVSSWTFSGGDLFPSQGAVGMINGFIFVPGGPGAPTGTPVNENAGLTPLYYDETNDYLYAYNGSWKKIGPFV